MVSKQDSMKLLSLIELPEIDWSRKIREVLRLSSRYSEGEILRGMDINLQSCMWLLWNTIFHMSSRNIQLFFSISKDLNKNSEKEDSAILLEVVSELHEKNEKLDNITGWSSIIIQLMNTLDSLKKRRWCGKKWLKFLHFLMMINEFFAMILGAY